MKHVLLYPALNLLSTELITFKNADDVVAEKVQPRRSRLQMIGSSSDDSDSEVKKSLISYKENYFRHACRQKCK